jgi:hypothetical protein
VEIVVELPVEVQGEVAEAAEEVAGYLLRTRNRNRLLLI